MYRIIRSNKFSIVKLCLTRLFACISLVSLSSMALADDIQVVISGAGPFVVQEGSFPTRTIEVGVFGTNATLSGQFSECQLFAKNTYRSDKAFDLIPQYISDEGKTVKLKSVTLGPTDFMKRTICLFESYEVLTADIRQGSLSTDKTREIATALCEKEYSRLGKRWDCQCLTNVVASNLDVLEQVVAVGQGDAPTEGDIVSAINELRIRGETLKCFDFQHLYSLSYESCISFPQFKELGDYQDQYCKCRAGGLVKKYKENGSDKVSSKTEGAWLGQIHVDCRYYELLEKYKGQ